MFETFYAFSTREEYRKVRGRIQEDIQNILGAKQSFLIDVAINEAINNALNSNIHDQPITIYIRKTVGRRLIIRVKDQGSGFHAQEVLEKISASHDYLFEERLLDESGRGLSIIKSATDRMVYNRTGTELLLMKYIENPEFTEAEVCLKNG